MCVCVCGTVDNVSVREALFVTCVCVWGGGGTVPGNRRGTGLYAEGNEETPVAPAQCLVKRHLRTWHQRGMGSRHTRTHVHTHTDTVTGMGSRHAYIHTRTPLQGWAAATHARTTRTPLFCLFIVLLVSCWIDVLGLGGAAAPSSVNAGRYGR